MVWVLLLSCAVWMGCGGREKEKPFRYFRNYSRTFNDMNPKHLGAAKQWGVEPLSGPEAIRKAGRKLEEVEDCRWYEVDRLTHSHPYLVPRAHQLLKRIGAGFRDSLDKKGLPTCRIVVTSVLRTGETVKDLRRGNINASANSAHLYGTTFDIAYARFKGASSEKTELDKLKSVLAEVLRDFRAGGQCYVRYEYKQGCFHITVR